MSEPNEYQIHIRQLLKTKRFLERVMRNKQKPDIQAEIDAIDFAIARINDCENAKPKEPVWCNCYNRPQEFVRIDNWQCCLHCRKPIDPNRDKHLCR